MAYPEEEGLDFVDYADLRIVRLHTLLPDVGDTSLTGNFPRSGFTYTMTDSGTQFRVRGERGGLTRTVSVRKEYRRRMQYAIRKILIHHHASSPRSTIEKVPADSAFAHIPRSLLGMARAFSTPQSKLNRAGTRLSISIKPGYAYHYDIGYQADTVRANGRTLNLVYQTQFHDRISSHTGFGQNEMGISISLWGSMRGIGSTNREGQFGTPDAGRPSEFQRACVPALVAYLQELYGISDLHVQGHFQHNKPQCPGWDNEFWILHKEETPRREERAFSWPVRLPAGPGGAGSAAPFLPADPAEVAEQARQLLLNTWVGGTGFYPFGRHLVWHNGVHLYPGADAPVFAIRDGWVIGARLNKRVKVMHRERDGSEREVDYGDANFVLVLHEDPGLTDPLDDRSKFGFGDADKAPRPLVYYSLYMHLAPIDTSEAGLESAAESLSWLGKLRDRGQHRDASGGVLQDRFQELVGDPEVARQFASVAIPVKAGEQIGTVGFHDPLAALDRERRYAYSHAFDASLRHTLHFEIFSMELGEFPEIIASCDPDRERAGRWRIDSSDATLFTGGANNAEKTANALGQLRRLAGITDAIADTLAEQFASADRVDPGHHDPTLWTETLTVPISDALSKIIVKHPSEWQANMRQVVDRNFTHWGMSREDADAFITMAEGFQWWGELARSEGAFRLADTGVGRHGAGDPNAHNGLRSRPDQIYYHPIRFLAWLNGLTRTLDHTPTGYNQADSLKSEQDRADEAAFYPTSTNINADIEDSFKATRTTAAAHAGDRVVSIPRSHSDAQLTGGSIRFAGSGQVYQITRIDRTSGLRLTLDPALDQDLRSGARAKLGNYGWHWEARFPWETSLEFS